MSDKNSVAVLDIGSGKILGLAGEISGDGGVLLKARAENPYSGFYGGDWLDRQDAREVIVKTLKQIENASGPISKIFVGVPGEFSVTVLREAEIKFNSPHKINTKDINGLFDAADDFSQMPQFKLICASPTYFVLDDGKKITTAHGMTATSVYGAVSFSFADREFCSFIEKATKKFGIPSVEFIPGNLAQALYTFSEAEREKVCALIDIGFVTASVSLAVGDGLLMSKSFSAGAGHIADDLCQVLEIDYDTADELRKKINLNLEFSEEDSYTAASRNINAVRVNEIVSARIEDIAEKINACITDSGLDLSSDATVYLSGGGLSYMKGGVNCLSKYLNARVSVAPAVSPEFDRPDYNSGYGLLHAAFRQNKKPKGFFSRLFGFARIK